MSKAEYVIDDLQAEVDALRQMLQSIKAAVNNRTFDDSYVRRLVEHVVNGDGE